MSDPILDLLAEAGMSGDAELGSLLSSMRSDATSIRPMPSAAVAALMPLRRGRRARGALAGRRRIVTGLIVLGSLGIGAGAAAASPDVRSAAQQFAQTVVGALGSSAAPSVPVPTPASHQPAGVAHPSNTGAPTHSTPTDRPGNGQGASHGGGTPTSAPGTGSPSPRPDRSPSDHGRSHHP